uniref:Kinesin-like protein n=1 Tax=Panagrolaimus davidi TaxID=227884 RepID=A0A914PJT1_9BILA
MRPSHARLLLLFNLKTFQLAMNKRIVTTVPKVITDLKDLDDEKFDTFSSTKNNSWKKCDKNDLQLFHHHSFGNEKQKQKFNQVEEMSFANNSTLSLHISAYENSIKSADNNLNVEKSSKTCNEMENSLQHSNSLLSTAFEIPRQQRDVPSTPEVMQFKSSQKLLNFNGSNAKMNDKVPVTPLNMNRQKETKKRNKKNVQVAIRIRPINEMEKGEKGKSIAHCDRVTKMVTMNALKEQKLFGPFDAVYGAEASQTDIYMDIVNPLIQEVLSGYNCTVFAYGQTGTGKTFTMEGRHDESNEYSWEEDPTAGIIPRALHHIFSELTALALDDYCVRVSYVELYNEELYDLLATGNVEDQTRLRIFDDKTYNGNRVLISGLTEVAVRGRDEVYRLLKRGAERRRTASTLMNMNSSRSHSVFTVSVLFRDQSTSKSEELLLKTGKLHLVDLAGSESIGRSGAVAARAREAGNINQSLLTLGRVINALTTNASHIPYRESKLTRILQDSLGGKTITTIIATLSPSSTNFEESVSTLDYAQRAKNIKNNPEVNQQVTRKALMNKYNEEIEQIKTVSAAALADMKEEKEKITKENHQLKEEKVEMEKRQKEDSTTISVLQKENERLKLQAQEAKDLQSKILILQKNSIESKEQMEKREEEMKKEFHLKIQELERKLKKASEKQPQMDLDADYNASFGGEENPVEEPERVENVVAEVQADETDQNGRNNEETAPGSRSRESRIILPANYIIGTELFRGEFIKHLYVFNSDDKTLCNNYSFRNRKNCFICSKCETKKEDVSATIKSANGEEYVQLGETPHVCDPEKYDPQMIIYENYMETTENWQGKNMKRLYVRDTDDYFFKYTWPNGCNTYRCINKLCNVSAHLVNDDEGKQCCVLLHRHKCQSKKLQMKL